MTSFASQKYSFPDSITPSSSSQNTVHVDKVNYAFAFTFFVTRIVAYGLGLSEFARDDPNFNLAVIDGWQPLTPVCLFAGYALNLFWFIKILEAAFKPRVGDEVSVSNELNGTSPVIVSRRTSPINVSRSDDLRSSILRHF